MNRTALVILCVLPFFSLFAENRVLLDFTITTNADSDNVAKTECVYDQRGNRILSTEYKWNEENNNWEIIAKNYFTYDDSNHMTLEAYYKWDSTQDSLGIAKREYAFDQSGNRTLYAEYKWDSSKHLWGSKSETEYDVKGQKTLSANYIWDSQYYCWVVTSKSEFAYDELGNDTLTILQIHHL